MILLSQMNSKILKDVKLTAGKKTGEGCLASGNRLKTVVEIAIIIIYSSREFINEREFKICASLNLELF